MVKTLEPVFPSLKGLPEAQPKKSPLAKEEKQPEPKLAEFKLPSEAAPPAPEVAQPKQYAYNREEATKIENLEDAIEFSKQHMIQEPKTIEEWRQLRQYVPPYELTEEQHNILQARVPITAWNAEAAFWAGVPADVIQRCVDMGGVNVSVSGWLPTDGGLRSFYDSMEYRLTSADRQGKPTPTLGERLAIMGVKPSDFSKLLNQDLQTRIEAGITADEGGGEVSTLDSEIIEENGVLYRVSGTRAIDEETGIEDFAPDGKYKVPVIPLDDTEIEKQAVTVMKPVEDTLTPLKPKLPEGYRYGEVENSMILPTGEIVLAKDDQEFNTMLKRLGVLPHLEFQIPTYSWQFPSFGEMTGMERKGDMKAVQKSLAQMVESEILTEKDIKDYLDGKVTLQGLNSKTQGIYWNREFKPPVPEDLEDIVAEAKADPEEFYELLQRKGRTIDMENLLTWMGATSEEIDGLFPGQERQPRSTDELIQKYETVNFEELGQKILALDASGDKDTVIAIVKEIGDMLEPTVKEDNLDMPGWIQSYKDGKYPIKNLIRSLLDTYYRQELKKLFAVEEGKEFRFEEQQPHERERILSILKALEVPDNYIKAVKDGVINPEKYFTAPSMYRYDPVGMDIGFFNDNQYAAYLVQLYLWVKMGDAERKGFWSINTDNQLSARARYEMWDAPPLVKGALEMVANPWYLIPIGGAASGILTLFGKTAAKGAAKLGAKGIAKAAEKFAEKAPGAIEKAESLMMKPVTYPLQKAGKAAIAVLKKTGLVKKFPELIIPDPKVEAVPDFLAYVRKHFPGRIKGNDMVRVVKEANLVHKRGLERGAGAIEIFRNQLSELGDITKLIGLDDAGEYVDNALVGLKKLTGAKADSQYNKMVELFKKDGKFGWNTVFENYKYFDFKNAKAQDWIEASHLILDTVVKYSEEAGITINKRIFEGLSEYFPRRVIGKKGIAEKALKGAGKRQIRIKGKISAEQRRMIEIFNDGLEKWDYDKPLETLLAVTEGLYRRIAGVEADSILKPFYKPAASETALGRWAKWFGTQAEKQQVRAKRLVNVVRRMKRGEQPAGSTLKAIKTDTPDLYEELMRAYQLKPEEFTKVINNVSKSVWRQLKITPQAFKAKVLEIRGGVAITNKNPLKIIEINDAIKAVVTEQRKSNTFVKDLWKQIYTMRKDQRNTVLENLTKDAENLLAERKIVGYAAKDKRKSIMQYLNHIGLTESYSPETFQVFRDVTVNGKLYTGREIEQAVSKIFNEDINSWLKGLSETARGFVTVEAAMDASAPFIQGFFVLGNDLKNLLAAAIGKGKPTAIWAQTFGNHIAAMFNPNVHRAFMRKYADVYRQYEPLGMIVGQGSIEFVETMPKLAKLSGKVPIIGKPLGWLIKQTFGRTSYGFSVWGEQARVLGIASMKDSWLKAGRNPRELTDLWNKVTGVVSTRAMGVSANQRAWESATLFAPRFARSQFLIIGDLFSRGATANMVRKIFGASLMAWGLAYVAACAGTNNEVNLNPLPEEYGGDGSKFMKLNIGGQWIGLPGFTSMMRMLSTVAADLATTPDRVMKIDWDKVNKMEEVKRDPLLRDLVTFPFRKASPVINLTKEMVTGKDFLGRTLEEGNDYLVDVMEKFMPILAQTLVTREKPATPVVWATEICGFNTYPQGELENLNGMLEPIVNEMVETLDLDDGQLQDLEDGKFNWYRLDLRQKQLIQRTHPEIKEQLELAENEAERWSSAEWRWFREQGDLISETQKTQDLIEFDRIRDPDSDYSTKDLRWDLSQNSTASWTSRKQLEQDPQFKVIQSDIDRSKRNKKQKGELRLFEVAWNAWWENVMTDEGVSDKLTDEEKYNLRQKRIEDFRDEYGETIYSAIRDMMNEKLKDTDPLKYKLANDKLALTDSYWRLVDRYGDPDRKARLELRKDPDNVALEATLVFWGYTNKFENPEAEKLVRQWMEEYNVPEKAIPAFSALLVPDKAVELYQVTQREWTEFNKIGETWERSDQADYYRWQYLLAHPNLNTYMVTETGRKDARLATHKIPESDAWLKLYNEKYMAMVTKDGKPDHKARREFRLGNPEFDKLGQEYGYWNILPEHSLKELGKAAK